jgi:hypothetical protein
VAISTAMGARTGLLVRDRRGLEEARNLDTVIFDKTGTLTLGEFREGAAGDLDQSPHPKTGSFHVGNARQAGNKSFAAYLPVASVHLQLPSTLPQAPGEIGKYLFGRLSFRVNPKHPAHPVQSAQAPYDDPLISSGALHCG